MLTCYLIGTFSISTQRNDELLLLYFYHACNYTVLGTSVFIVRRFLLLYCLVSWFVSFGGGVSCVAWSIRIPEERKGEGLYSRVGLLILNNQVGTKGF
jgi:hypothetical protein